MRMRMGQPAAGAVATAGTGPTAIELALWPLDRVRNRLLKWLTPWSGMLAGAREARVAVLGLVMIACSALLAVGAPFWLLAVGPIALGVPHLVADVRYCVCRPGHHRRRALWVAAGLPLLAGAVLHAPAVSLAAVAGAAAVGVGPGWRRWSLISLAGSGAGVSLVYPSAASLALVHGHNFFAVALWWAWRPRRSRLHLLPLSLFVGVSVAIMLGAFDASLGFLIAGAPSSLGLSRHLAHLAPGFSPEVGARLVLSYAFAQSVHYVMWLRLVPEDDRDRISPRTFRASYRALIADMGAPLLLLAGGAALALAVWAAIDLAGARFSYLRFASFHVTLELVAATLLFVEGRPRASQPERTTS